MLRALGVAAPEERAYRALVGHPSATPGELATELDVDVAELVGSLDLLAARGLVARSGGRFDRYVAAPPTAAIGALLNQQRAELRQVELTLSDLAEQYRRAVGGRSVGDLIEVVTGIDAIRYRFDQVKRNATDEVLSFVLTPSEVIVPGESTVDGATPAYRLVVAREVLERPGVFATIGAALAAGGQIRVVDSLPLRMVVADRSVALVPLSCADEGEPGAVLVHPSGVLNALVALFEAVWWAALPLRSGTAEPRLLDRPDFGMPSDVTDTDTRILSLLLVGLTDRSVASQLGLSMRTVQRRVRYLMDVAGVQTRLQLGWYAARHGWV